MVTINHPSANKNNLFHLTKQVITNPSFQHFVGGVISKVVVKCGKKFYFNYSSEYKVNTADVTSTNILKCSCANPTPNEYANIRNINNHTLHRNCWINQQVCSSCLDSVFPIKHLMHLLNVLFLKMVDSRKKFHNQYSSFKSNKNLKT